MATNYMIGSAEKKPVVDGAGLAAGRHGVDENSLIAAAKSGQDGAFDELWQRYAGRILRITRRITGNHADGEDAMQDSFLLAFVHIKNFDGRSRFSSWLTRIAINSALMIVRKKQPALTFSIDNLGKDSGKSGLRELRDRSSDPEEAYAQREQELMLRRAIRALRPKVRRAIELQQLHERSVNEMAAMMGLSKNAAKARLFHAKAALRKSLAPVRSIRPARMAREFRAASVA